MATVYLTMKASNQKSIRQKMLATCKEQVKERFENAIFYGHYGNDCKWCRLFTL